MFQYLPNPSVIVGTLVTLLQGVIGYLYFGRARASWPKTAFRLGAAGLGIVWAITAAGIWFDMRQVHSAAVTPAVTVGTTWGFVSGLALAAYGLVRLAERLRGAEFSPGRRRALLAAAVAAPAALTGFGILVERTRYRVEEVDLPLPNLHPDLEGLSIVQISDLHVSAYLSPREAGRVVDMANELKARVALMTGDLISGPGDPLDATIAEIARLRAEAGVFGCLGNHEIYAQCEAYTAREARKKGVDFLRQRARELRFGQATLNLAGVDFQPFKTRGHYLRGAESMVRPGATNLLLSHNPDVFPTAVRKGFDGVISGHTHGGQVTVEILNRTANLARFFTPFVAGLYRMEGRSCYVNAGIGTIGMPVRIGAPPEITLFRLHKA